MTDRTDPHETHGPDAGGTGLPECPRHPGRAAYMACVGCRRPACLECQAGTTSSGHVVCLDCAARREQERAAGVPRRRSALRDTPVLVWMLIGLNALVYAGQWVTLGSSADLTAYGWYAPGQTSTVVMEPYRMLSNAFLHSLQNPGHLVLNMLALWMLGRVLVRPLGTARFLTLYALSALGGSVAVLWMSDPLTPVLGASGAIYGLFAAVFVLARARGGNIGSLTVLLAVNLVFSLTVPGISWQGHIGGLAAGALVAGCFELLGPGGRAGRAPGRRAPWVQWAGVAAVLAVLVLLTAVGAARITPAMLWP